MDSFYSNISNTVMQNAENVISNDDNKELQYNQTFSVKVPSPGEKVVMDMDDLVKIKTECDKIKKNKFPYAEISLGLSTLFLGAFLSALISQISYECQFLSILFYSICPTIGIGLVVVYLFCRNNEMRTANDLAERIENHIRIEKKKED